MKAYLLIMLVLGTLIISCTNAKKTEVKAVTFVSFPDFFNFDIPNPWPDYEEAIDYFLGQVNNENPDFVLVCGDLVNGHWWDSPESVEHLGAVYYGGWVRRMQEHGLKFYTAVGDHEMGDDPWPAFKRELIPSYRDVYNEMLQMPQNGPANFKGLSYFVRQGDLLVITVDPFDLVDDSMRIQVVGEQLAWFDKVLTENNDAKFKIVQCHVGIWGEIKARSSSSLMLEGGQDTDFYRTMKKHGVDAVLVGEFHDVTVHESDGIWQIVHGSSWGREVVNTEDYLVGSVVGNKMTLTLKRIYMDASGDFMWNINKNRGPQQRMMINEKTVRNGSEVTGVLVIENSNGVKSILEKSGYFSQK